jgi:hypothetical protein
MSSFDVLLEDHEFAFLSGLTGARYVIGFRNRFENWLPEEWSQLQKLARHSLAEKKLVKGDPLQVSGPLSKAMRVIVGTDKICFVQTNRSSAYLYHSDDFCHIEVSRCGNRHGLRLLRKEQSLAQIIQQQLVHLSGVPAASRALSLPSQTLLEFRRVLPRQGALAARRVLAEHVESDQAVWLADQLTRVQDHGSVQALRRLARREWTSELVAYLVAPDGCWRLQPEGEVVMLIPSSGERILGMLTVTEF